MMITIDAKDPTKIVVSKRRMATRQDWSSGIPYTEEVVDSISLELNEADSLRHFLNNHLGPAIKKIRSAQIAAIDKELESIEELKTQLREKRKALGGE